MNQNKLLLSRAIFTLIIIVAFGLIIMNEKGNLLFSKKAENRINDYLKDNYSSLNNISKSDVTYDNKEFKMKITSKENNNHYFYITYKNKEIKDTYKEDYVEGKNILNYLTKKIEKEINENCTITPTTTLDNYSETVQERIIKEEDLLSLKFYVLTKEIKVEEFEEELITNKINEFISKLTSKNITPKYYTIIITDKNDITKSIKINQITDSIDINTVKDILNNKQLVEKRITYEYIN